MEVLIVSKTRMKNNFACVGGLVLENNTFVRLLNPGRFNQSVNGPFNIGDVFDINYYLCPERYAPHIEDVIVQGFIFRRRIENISGLLRERNLISWRGHVDNLFDRLLVWTSSGSAYIPEHGPFPNQSVGFWVSNVNLTKSVFGDRVRYRYPNRSDYRSLSYVGFQDPLDEIPAGTVIRVSLSRLFPKPGSDVQAPQGYYLQLSGWYSEDDSGVGFRRNQPFSPSDDIIPGYHHIAYADDYFERYPGADYYQDVPYRDK